MWVDYESLVSRFIAEQEASYRSTVRWAEPALGSRAYIHQRCFKRSQLDREIAIRHFKGANIYRAPGPVLVVDVDKGDDVVTAGINSRAFGL